MEVIKESLHFTSNRHRQPTSGHIIVPFPTFIYSLTMKNTAIQLALIRIYVFLFLVLSLDLAEAQNTVTITETSTQISTVTVTKSDLVSAKLVNVTAACRRRRGFLIDEPVVLTFDDGLGEFIDEAFRNALHAQFIPSRTLDVEVTPLMVQLPSINVQQRSSNYYRNRSVPPSPTIQVVQPSVPSDTRYDGRRKIGVQWSNPEPRLYFSQINAFLNAIANNFRRTVTVTVTNYVSQTTSVTVGGTTSTALFVMVCTPSPFPFPTCPAANRRSSPN